MSSFAVWSPHCCWRRGTLSNYTSYTTTVDTIHKIHDDDERRHAAVRRLVATSLSATWHLEFVRERVIGEGGTDVVVLGGSRPVVVVVVPWRESLPWFRVMVSKVVGRRVGWSTYHYHNINNNDECRHRRRSSFGCHVADSDVAPSIPSCRRRRRSFTG
jgi:hypothetical protein